MIADGVDMRSEPAIGGKCLQLESVIRIPLVYVRVPVDARIDLRCLQIERVSLLCPNAAQH
jgi:hypothetical protein